MGWKGEGDGLEGKNGWVGRRVMVGSEGGKRWVGKAKRVDWKKE